MTTLARIEASFQAYVLDGDCDFLRHVQEDSGLDAEARAAIYADGYRLRLIEALAAEYEVLARHLGAAFDALAREFIASQPSKTRSLRWYAPAFADFLQSRGADEAAAIAGFERALRDAFDAPDHPVATVDLLMAVAPEDWGALTFEFHPSVRFVSLAWSAPALWQNEGVGLLAEPQNWLIWRQGLMPMFRKAEAAETAAFEVARGGGRFDDICAMLAELAGEAEAPAMAAMILRNWIEPGLIGALGRAEDGC